MGIKLGIGWRSDVASDAKQGAKGVEGIETAVEAEGEFVEIHLQMLRADTMMNTAQPCFEIGEHEVNNRQKGFSDLPIAPLCNGGMAIAALAQLRITTPVVGDDAGAGNHRAFDEAAQRFGAPIWNHGELNTAGVPPGLPLVETTGTLALPNLDRAGQEHHVVDATSLAASTSTNVGFVGLNDLPKLTSNPILVGAHYASA